MQQVDIRRIKISEEFRTKIPNNRILRVRSDFSGTPIYIRCTSGTGLVPPSVVLIPDDCIAEIHFQDNYLIGQSHTFIINEQERVINEYVEPANKKSVAGLMYFRDQIKKSQESLNQTFYGNALSFDQSYFTRTIGQIVIQHKLEQKIGRLADNFNVFSGGGFGAIQAFSCAIGYKADELNTWYTNNLLKSVKRSYLQKGYEVATSIVLNHDHDRIKASKLEKEIKFYFKSRDMDGNRTKKDLLVSDCIKDVYIPVWDISRRTMVITKKTFPDMPIWLAVCASMLDPIFFDAKPYFDGFGVMGGSVSKNNDVFLKKFNPSLSVTSIGSPVRVFDKGLGRIIERSKLIKKDEESHDIQLDWSRSCGSVRYECNPIDEFFQFASSDKAIKSAQKSGDVDAV